MSLTPFDPAYEKQRWLMEQEAARQQALAYGGLGLAGALGMQQAFAARAPMNQPEPAHFNPVLLLTGEDA